MRIINNFGGGKQAAQKKGYFGCQSDLYCIICSLVDQSLASHNISICIIYSKSVSVKLPKEQYQNWLLENFTPTFNLAHM